MAYLKIWIHAVWGTKNRQPILKPPILNTICTHIAGNAKDKGIYIDRINGHDDHVHVLMLLKADLSIAKQIQLLKGESAYWANKNNLINGVFEWSAQYFAASVSNDKVNLVRNYIDRQQTHHQRRTFQEEYQIFLKGIGYIEGDFS
ncbi:IS200/IS605 family transposase [Dyadobacter psychrotolerans]|uniref:IS200/IS605 family transposase n=1 Tax=Dyadobacter psychrotolerans TaxID=2541721 RepID=A0A4R5DRY7_9BACT|nr:IS200/IS605 family transposase [Dyadobacter psychrotolerans]TDE16467.1 IS200/IS605 family transposase [Dyadobacter psychrotolerans]